MQLRVAFEKMEGQVHKLLDIVVNVKYIVSNHNRAVSEMGGRP